jgi:hypothetical protein
MLKLTWNEADGHYDLTDNDEFLMAIAKVDVPKLISLLEKALEE